MAKANNNPTVFFQLVKKYGDSKFKGTKADTASKKLLEDAKKLKEEVLKLKALAMSSLPKVQNKSKIKAAVHKAQEQKLNKKRA